MSLLASSLCRTCAHQRVALQPGRIPGRILTYWPRRSLSTASGRPVSLGTKITPKVIEERRKKHTNAKPLPLRRKLKNNSLEPELSLGDQIKAALASNAPVHPVPKNKAKEKNAPNLGDQIKAALTSDAPVHPVPKNKAKKGKKAKKAPKPQVKGLDNTAPLTPDEFAKSFMGVSLPEKKHKSKPTKTDNIGMLNSFVATTSTKKAPALKSPIKTPPQVHAAEEAFAKRFNPKQPTASQQYHAEKKTVLRANKGQKREIHKQAGPYEMQPKVADGKKSRAPPSKESGGVPDPSQDYLVKLEEPSQRLDEPQPLLVVVDLNGTMLYRPNPKRQPRTFVKRPFSSVFFNYCVKTFWVVVWSSARADNVAAMCDNLSSPDVMRNNVVAVWARDRFGLSPKDFDGRVQCYKRLTKLWQDPHVARSHPHYAEGGRWSQANTVLIDDTPEKARAEPHNAVIVPEFSNDNSKYDGILPSVHDYLNELCFQSNVSNYMRENPFYIRSDIEAVAEKPVSTEFYEEKQATKEKKKSRLPFTYEPSSLSLKRTATKHKWDSIAKQRAGQ